jgi:hypothetical protein
MALDDDPNKRVSIPIGSLIALLGARGLPAAPPAPPVDTPTARAQPEPAIQTIKVQVLPDGRMDCKNAARYYGASEKTMATWRTQGKGPRFVKIGGRVFYFKDDLDVSVAEARGARG